MKRVMVFGTFDGVHPGHLNFFQQANKFGDYLIVVVARDQTVSKLKGKKPVNDENQRLAAFKSVSGINKAVLGDLADPYVAIKKFKPQIIYLGYDQKFFIEPLKKLFPEIEIKRGLPYKPDIYKSSKLNKKYD